MKRKVLTLALAFMALTAKAQTGILMLHYGTLNEQARRNTLEKIDSLVHGAFSQVPVETAYMANGILRGMEKQGIYGQTAAEGMAKLIRKGCSKILVQTTFLLDGTMMKEAEREVNLFAPKVKQMIWSKPLIYSTDDGRFILEVLQKEIPHAADEQVVLVGHGSADAANAMYSQLEYLAAHAGFPEFTVGTIEGFPSLDDVLERLQERKVRKVVLVPLLYIAGNHQVKDINGVWKETLEKAGFQVRVVNRGLGELPIIQEHILHQMNLLLNHEGHE